MNSFNKKILGVFFALTHSQFVLAAGSGDDVKQMLSRTFDKPNNPVTTEAVVVQDNYALADWTQGSKGGRVLLVKTPESWKVLVCGGEALLKLYNIKGARVPEKTAQSLVSQLVDNEKMISNEKIKRINSFKGEKH